MVAKFGAVLMCDAISNIVGEVCILQNVSLVPEQWCNLITVNSFFKCMCRSVYVDNWKNACH